MANSGKRVDREEKLLQASRKGDLEAVLNLLKPKIKSGVTLPSIDINCKGKSKSNLGWTPLHLAAYFGNKDVVQVLVEHGANVNARNGMGDTPLHRAAFTGRTDVVMLLLQHNADVTTINGEGKTPSQVANMEDIKQLIVAAERSMQLKLEEELLTAAREGDGSKLKSVLSSQYPPNLNCQDIMGNTPLHCAAYRGHKEVAVWLLQHGADTSIKNSNGQMAFELTKDIKMKQLLDVQPLQVMRFNNSIRKLPKKSKKAIHKTVQRHEGCLLKRSRFWGWKKYWVVLERGVFSYYSKRADAASGTKRQGFKYLDHAKFSVPQDEKHKIKIEFSDNTVQIWSIHPNDQAAQLHRQRWLNSLHEHCAYSTHFVSQPMLLVDEYDEDFVSLGTMQDTLKGAQAQKQLLEQQIAAADTLITALNDSTKPAGSKSHLAAVKVKLVQIMATAKDMYLSLGHCLDLFSQQEELRRLQLDEEVEKRRVLEDALHVLATEHHALECSLGVHELIQGSRLTLTSDNDEFFDAVSDLAGSPPHDFQSDSDDDGDIYIPTFAQKIDSRELQEDKRRTSNEGLSFKTKSSSEERTHKKRRSEEIKEASKVVGMRRSTSDGDLLNRLDVVAASSDIQKSKSDSYRIDDNVSVTTTSDNTDDDVSIVSNEQEAELRNGGQLVKKPYRTSLPAVMLSRNDFSVWTVLKHCIGKDLSRITMPVIFNEPLTFLQRIGEYMEYAYLLHKAATVTDSLERMQLVAAFAVSSTASNLDRVGKPFNPLLGETYELEREDMGFRLIAEQVSHHPPISAFQCEAADFCFHVTVQPKLKFWGKGVEIQPKGMVTLKLPKYNEVYTWNNVNSCVHNIIVGQLWIEQLGQIEINNHSTGESCVMHFKPAGWFGRDPNKVEGTIYSSDKKRKYVLKGDWTDKLVCYPATESQHHHHLIRKRSFRGAKDTELSQDSGEVISVASGDSGDSSTSGESFAGTISDASPSVLWYVHQRPANSRKMYNFTTFAMQLNEVRREHSGKLPPTDSRLRPDCRAMELGDYDRAASEKIRLEEKQRATKRERQKRGEEWTPRWFKEETNPYTGQVDWLFTEKYWDRDFSCCPNIF